MPDILHYTEDCPKAILDSLPIGILITDEKGQIVGVNSLVEKIWAGSLFGSVEEYENYKGWRPDGKLIKPEDWALAKAVKAGQTTVSEIIEIERFDGTRGTIVNSAAPVKNDKGEVIGAVAFNQDITYQRELEKEVEELRLHKELANLERLKLVGQLAGTIGHEVRNPLTSVKGFLQLLSTKKNYAEDKEFFDLMIGEINRATNILSEFLYLSQTKPVATSEQDLNTIIRAIAPLIAAEALGAEVNFGMVLGEIPRVKVDEKEIRQLILNLTRNAIEATEAGKSVDISTSSMGQEVIMSIRDEGRGIPPEVLSNIGSPFVTTKEKGTGLGLSVCYSIAHRHNAKVDFETGPEGTMFSIRFPK